MDEFTRNELQSEYREGLRNIVTVLQQLNLGDGAAQAAPALQALQQLIGDNDRYERDIDQFTFEVPPVSLQQHLLHLGAIKPERNKHFQDRNGVLYRNSNPASYEELDPEVAGWNARRNHAIAHPDADDAALQQVANLARDAQLARNRAAHFETPNWELLQREANNDVRAEDSLLVFSDPGHKIVDWFCSGPQPASIRTASWLYITTL